MTEIGIIIINYNSREELEKCLNSLEQHPPSTSHDIMVLDNGSYDGSEQMVKTKFNHITFIQSEKNLGFGQANNLIAQQLNTKYYLLLNPDTEVFENSIDILYKFAKSRPDNGIYGGQTVYADGSINIASCWNKMTLWSLICSTTGLSKIFAKSEFFNPEKIGDWKRDSVREIDIVVGCFMLIEAALWDKLRGFNPKYWLYGEESDLCLRAKKISAQPIITPEAVIMHSIGASSSDQSQRKILVLKSKITLIKDHWPKYQQKLGIGLMVLESYLRHLKCKVQNCPDNLWTRVWNSKNKWIDGYE